MDLDLYTGNIMFRDINFLFSYYNDELRLIPPNEQIKQIRKWLGYEEQADKDLTVITEDYLVGNINETGQRIIFFIYNQKFGNYNDVIVLKVKHYIILDKERKISKLEFCSDEIDLIYSPKKAFGGFSRDKNQGTVELYLKHNDTRNDVKIFKFENQEIKMFFECTSNIKVFGGSEPISIHSLLVLSFDETDDYQFIINLFYIVKKLLMFMFNTQHISTQKCQLYSKDEDKYVYSGEFYTANCLQSNIENEILENYMCIRYDCIKESLSMILQDIAEEKLYLRHLPKYYEDNAISPSRFVMLVAGFENLFNTLYPQGVEHSNSTKDEIKKLEDKLREVSEKWNSFERRSTDNFIKHLHHESIHSRLMHAYKQNQNLINFFAEYLFRINELEFDFSQVADSIQKYRNHFAHGNVFDDFDSKAIVGLILLERINYIMHLKYYDVSDDMIKVAINELFHCGLKIIY